ncbi:hypothetical protein TPHA_0G02500 [Tetrapisispora phaffii CBS 4417]|uniref:Uncharacterized protein n=1 Tax=Tetrapisispora phaffii (strain ATCC 24235 / CBS 4417 / NBRC 1672 / NRRL Y-8282 / UCD 70-5) TaxID=1071381 RepID=G8BW07_TETPH|nr:hypothetical protein TPHA_0G02500 [Tetrapisispora phaffii CBS 4417]CCE64085.1 hypothetical protein TPHA_0G02500 [Tetrapisispora phaffii CBS 4417]
MHLRIPNKTSIDEADDDSLSALSSLVSINSEEGTSLSKIKSNVSDIIQEQHIGNIDDIDDKDNETVDTDLKDNRLKKRDRFMKKSTPYSADFKPLMFKMKVPENNENDRQSPNKNSFKTMKKELNKDFKASDNIVHKDLINIRERLINLPIDGSSLFNTIDEDQLSKYLQNPTYIKLYRKRKDMTRFNRMFMAQELRIEKTNNTTISSAKDENGDRSDLSDTITPTKSSNSNGNVKTVDVSKSIWVTKFSLDGKYMATAGKDGNLRIWKVISSLLERWDSAKDDSSRNTEVTKTLTDGRSRKNSIISPIKSNTYSDAGSSLNNFEQDFKQFLDLGERKSRNNDDDSTSNVGSDYNDNSTLYNNSTFTSNVKSNSRLESADQNSNSGSTMNLFAPVFKPRPVKVFQEHTNDILDLDWSRNGFILTSSIDKTVKLWHTDKNKSLRTFSHPDFVTTVKFHPIDDRFFISGCIDQKCRLWSILDEQVSYEYHCQDLITTLTVSLDGKFTIVGTLNGYIHVLETEGLKFHSAFHVRQRVALQNLENPGEPPLIKNRLLGPRITGLQCIMPENTDNLRILATCDDSKIRIIQLSDKTLLEYLKGFQSKTSQHHAQLSMLSGEPVVISSSDDHWVYFWTLQSNSDEAHRKSIPRTGIHRSLSFKSLIGKTLSSRQKKGRPRADSDSRCHHLHLPNLLRCNKIIRNSAYIAFHAHTNPITTAVLAPPETAKILSLSNDLICELSSEYFMETENKIQESLTNSTLSDSSSDVQNIKLQNKKVNRELDKSFNLKTHSTLPNMIDVVGTIIVSTDTSGNIRVFRVDMPSRIRKMALQKLKDRKRKEGLSSITPTPSDMSTNATHNDSEKPCLSSVKFDSLYGSLRYSGYSMPESSSSNNTENEGNNSGTVIPSLPNDSQCSVCNGTKFELRKDIEMGPNMPSYYCTECGTVYNNFR